MVAGGRGGNRRRATRVMLVERNTLVRAELERSLRTVEIELLASVATAEDARRHLRSLAPDIVLVDVDLPGRSGFELVREICGDHRNATRVVVLSDRVREDDVLHCLRWGAAGYLTRHITPAALHRALLSVMDGQLAIQRPVAAMAIRRLASMVGRPSSSSTCIGDDAADTAGERSARPGRGRAQRPRDRGERWESRSERPRSTSAMSSRSSAFDIDTQPQRACAERQSRTSTGRIGLRSRLRTRIARPVVAFVHLPHADRPGSSIQSAGPPGTCPSS